MLVLLCLLGIALVTGVAANYLAKLVVRGGIPRHERMNLIKYHYGLVATCICESGLMIVVGATLVSQHSESVSSTVLFLFKALVK